MKTCAGGEGERINLRRKNEEEDKQKVGRKKRRKMGKEENLVGRLIRWGRGRRFFFIEKKNREEPSKKAYGSLEDLGSASGMVSLSISYGFSLVIIGLYHLILLLEHR